MGFSLALKSQRTATGHPMLDNDDLRPTPREKRTWNAMTFNLFWFAAVTNVSNWLGGASFLSMGVTFWEGVACSTAGYFIVAIFMTFNGRIGAVRHIGFPVACRSSFGVLGAYWPVINRSLSSLLWNGVNSVSGGQCVYICLYAIFPSIRNVPNHMSSGSALTTKEMIGFFLFIFCMGLMLLVPVAKWTWLIRVKVAVFVLSTIGMIAWGVTAAGGAGPVISASSTVHGSEKSWLLVRFILTSAASCATFASNAADWQRNATRPSDPILGQLIGFPISNLIVSILGMLVASTSAGVYGEVIWNPIVYLQRLLEDNYTPAHRAGAFFIAAGFVFSMLYSCAVENVYPFANDFAALAPKYISFKRAMFTCVALTMAINPWYLLGSAGIFVSVIASYQIFLFSIMAILLTDYYIVTRGALDIEELFTLSPSGKYYYTCGVNPRAITAYFVGIGVNFAGFLSNFGIITGTKLEHSYYFAIFTSTFAAGFTYWSLTKVFPQANEVKGQGWLEPKGVWEPEVDSAIFEHRSDEASSVDDSEDAKDDNGMLATAHVVA